MYKIDYVAYKTAAKFIQSDAFYTLLLGDRGAGKTTAGLMRVLAKKTDKAFQTWAIVGDTRKRLGYTIGRTIDNWCPEPYTVWGLQEKNRPHQCVIHNHSLPVVRFDFFGIQPAGGKVDDLFPYEAMYDGIWFDDVDKWSFATKHLVQAVCLLRACSKPSIQITSNFLPADHWVNQMWQLHDKLPPKTKKERAQAHVRQQSGIFQIPDEENAAELISPGYLSRCRDMKELL